MRILLLAFVVSLAFLSVPGRLCAQDIADPKEQIEKFFPDQIDWLLDPPNSVILLISVSAAIITSPEYTPIIGDVLKLGPRPTRWVHTAISLIWEERVQELGPRPFKEYEREALFEWDREYRALGPKPKLKDNKEAYDKWNLEFLRIMQKYGALNQPGADTGSDESTVDFLYPPFLEVLKLRLYEALGYYVEGVNVFKVQTPQGWYPELYYLLKWNGSSL